MSFKGFFDISPVGRRLGGWGRDRTGQTESDWADDFSREALSISRGESRLDRLAELGELARGKDGSDEVGLGGRFFPRKRILYREAREDQTD